MKRGFLNGPKATKTLPTDKPVEKRKASEPTKLSYGVVKQAGRPQGYSASKIKIVENDGNAVDYPDDHTITTTQPAQLMGTTLADEPDGWSECYITGFVKRQILSTPGFPKPIARRSTSVHKIVHVPGKGLGIFSTQDLQPGDLIFAERPILVLPKAMSLPLDLPDHLSAEQGRQALMYEYEKQILEPLFARVCPELQKAYLDLHNAHKSDGSGPLLGVHRTNGFAVGLRDKGKPHETSYSGIVKDGSRFNHSCTPNVANVWDKPSFSFQFRALCYVKAGEELTVSYCNLTAPAAERRKALEPYGFRCACVACQNPTASDPRRHMYYKSMPNLTDLIMWVANPRAPADQLRNCLLEQLRICEEEKLHSEGGPTHAYLDLLILTYTLMADKENTLKYGRILGQQLLAYTGDDTKLKELSQIDYHRKQPTWGYKTRPTIGPLPPMQLEYYTKFMGSDPTDMKPRVFAVPFGM